MKKGNGSKLTFVNIGALKKEGLSTIPRPNMNKASQFSEIQKDQEVAEFMHKFEAWNIAQEKSVSTRTWQKFGEFVLSFMAITPSMGALDALNKASRPYISLQEALADKVEDYVKPEICIVDLGCGRLDFVMRLFERNPMNLKNIYRIFAMDLDDRLLRDIVERLLAIGYEHDIALIQSMTGYALPFWKNSIDICVSSLGASMYAFAWINGENLYGQPALKKHLQDIHRFLKPGGIFAFSAPKPKPDWGKVLRDSIIWPIKNRRLGMLIQTLTYGPEAKKRSQFMNEYEKKGYAFYLDPEAWTIILEECGFEVLEVAEGGDIYAGQGLVMVAMKGDT